MSEGKYLKIAAAVILPNVGGWMGGLITQQNIKPWYESLNKPKFNPPNYAFGPVWTGIYCGIGYASYLVYDGLLATGFNRTAQIALGLYANQLILNWAWTPIFFHYHSLKWVRIITFTFSINYILKLSNEMQSNSSYSSQNLYDYGF